MGLFQIDSNEKMEFHGRFDKRVWDYNTPYQSGSISTLMAKTLGIRRQFEEKVLKFRGGVG